MKRLDYSNMYSENKLWEKIQVFAKKAGKEVVVNVLKLYYAMVLGKASAKQVAIILSALGYFIMPADMMPDVFPGGLIDDAGLLVAVVTTLRCCADKEVVEAAKAKSEEWFDGRKEEADVT